MNRANLLSFSVGRGSLAQPRKAHLGLHKALYIMLGQFYGDKMDPWVKLSSVFLP